MADKTTESSKKTRAEGRERRRSLAAEPFEQLDEAARESDSGRSEAARTVKHALATGVAGAVAAGLGGATKAWLDRRSASGSEEPEREGTEKPSSESAEQDVDASEAEGAEEPVGEADAAEDESEPEQAEAEDPRSEATPRGETEAIVSTARDQLEQLLEREVESVSGFERSDGRWCVTLEVVEVRRIPESTDVLGSYEVVLDEGQNLVSFGQTRRYRRSQVEEG
jgi:hypothetical protein